MTRASCVVGGLGYQALCAMGQGSGVQISLMWGTQQVVGAISSIGVVQDLCF